MRDNLLVERFTNEAFRGENTNDALTRHEKRINEERAKAQREQQAEDRAVREKLEKQSSANYARRSFVDVLNGQSDQRRAHELPHVVMLEGIRKQQEIGRRTAEQHNRSHEVFEKAYGPGGENFNRLHPDSHRLERAGASAGSYHPAPSAFNFGDDPGNVDGSRFEADQRFDPPQSAGRVRDAEGSLSSDDARARDHWNSGRVGEVSTGWMLREARRLLQAVRQRSYGQRRV